MNTQIIFKHTEGKPTSLKSLMFFLHTFMSFYPQGYCVYTVFIHTSVSYYISWSDANSNCFWNPRTSLLFKFAAFFNVFHAEAFPNFNGDWHLAWIQCKMICFPLSVMLLEAASVWGLLPDLVSSSLLFHNCCKCDIEDLFDDWHVA